MLKQMTKLSKKAHKTLKIETLLQISQRFMPELYLKNLYAQSFQYKIRIHNVITLAKGSYEPIKDAQVIQVRGAAAPRVF